MSLDSPKPVKKWPIGVIVSRSFDNPDLLVDILSPHIEHIDHVHTNGSQPGAKLVEDFCRDNKLVYTVWPSTKHAFYANGRVVDNSSFVYIITDGKSKSAKQAEAECVAKPIRFKVLHYDPVTAWKQKVEWAREVLARFPTPADDSTDSPEVAPFREAIEGIRKVLK